MQHTITSNPCADTYLEITVDVTGFSGAREAKINCLPEDSRPYESAEIEYNIINILGEIDGNAVASIGNSLEFPESCDQSEFDAKLIKKHERFLADQWDDEDRPKRRRL